MARGRTLIVRSYSSLSPTNLESTLAPKKTSPSAASDRPVESQAEGRDLRKMRGGREERGLNLSLYLLGASSTSTCAQGAERGQREERQSRIPWEIELAAGLMRRRRRGEERRGEER